MSAKKSKLLKNTLYLYILTFVKMIFPIITLPYLTRVLSIDNYGLVAYVKSYNAYVQLIIDFGFILSATKLIVRFKNDYSKVGRVTGNVLVEKAILVLLGIISTIFLTEYLELLGSNKLFVWLFFLSSVTTILIPDFLFRGLERMEYVTIPFLISKTLVLILTFVKVKGDADLLYIPILEILGNIIAASISFYFIFRIRIGISFDNYKIWIADLKDSSIYFFSNFATTIFGTLTTLIVGVYLGKIEIAYWSICMQIVAAVKSLYNPIVNSIYPYMLSVADLSLVRKISMLFAIPIFFGSVVILFWGEAIMVLIGGTNFYQAGEVLKMLLPVFTASFYSMLIGWPVLGTRGMEKETTVTTMKSAVLQIAGIALLISINQFELTTLAICCSISEVYLLISRLFLLGKLKSGDRR